jgi:hypothetical protein
MTVMLARDRRSRRHGAHHTFYLACLAANVADVTSSTKEGGRWGHRARSSGAAQRSGGVPGRADARRLSRREQDEPAREPRLPNAARSSAPSSVKCRQPV